MNIYEKRRSKLIADMKHQNFSGLIFSPSSDYLYLTGSHRKPGERAVILFLTPQHSFLLLPDFEADNEQELQKELELIPYSDLQHAETLLLEHLPKEGTIAVGKEVRASFLLTLQELAPQLCWRSAEPLICALRVRKDPEEIRIIETAQHMAERALSRLLEESLIGKTEVEIASRLMQLRLEEGFDSVGNGIVATGPNTALVHHINGQRKLQKQDILMFDIGGTYRGYHADFTRTFAVGSLPEDFETIYQIVLNAHYAGKAAAMPGVTASSVDQAARTVIADAGYGKFFPHRLGHGIGLDVHESPFLTGNNDSVLTPGNVFSCEPGIYLPGKFGIRIEDLLVMETDGPRSLNTLPKKLQIL